MVNETRITDQKVESPALEADKADTRSGYVDVSSSRSLGTTEVNDTSSDLDVSVIMTVSSAGDTINSYLNVDGVNADRVRATTDTTADRHSVSATVPAGSEYTVGDTNDGVVFQWSEQQ